MAKRINNISIPLHDLLECIVAYSDFLDTPPPDAIENPDGEEKPYRRTFTVETAQQKLEAIEKILWDEGDDPLKRGNRSFAEHDENLLLETLREMGADTSKEALLEACLPYAQTRGADIKDDAIRDESIRVRLEKVYKNMQIRMQSIEKYDQEFAGYDDSYEEEIKADISLLSPWLEKYRDEIIAYYGQNSGHNDCVCKKRRFFPCRSSYRVRRIIRRYFLA
ncbi:MAG: hypothetical protein KDI13_07005 [Alphaproteobacteria bacterium]|nr:hypothetical protein [Alphaproteobacteria bacterium]